MTLLAGDALCFGRALSDPENERLRLYVRRILGDREAPGALVVDTFLELVEQLSRVPRDDVQRSPCSYLLFDLQRLLLFIDSGVASKPGISSLIRFLLDGYPLQPFRDFALAERNHSYRLGFDLAVLDLVPRCLAELRAGDFCVLDLVTGEVLRGKLAQHPLGANVAKVVLLSEPARVSPLQAVSTPRTLRSAAQRDLGDLIDKNVGVVRRADVRSNFASLALGTAAIQWRRGATTELCYGIATTAEEARTVALFEAAERFQFVKQSPTAELVRGSYDELAAYAIDPRCLFFGRSPECPDDEGEPFDPAVEIHWTWAWGPTEDRWRLVPAQEIWFNTADLMAERRFVYTTSNGCAVGSTFEEAAVFAALEAIERDAFLTSWYLRRPATEIDLDSFETDQMRDLLGRFRLAFPHYRAALFNLTSDVGVPTVGGLAIRNSGGGPCVFASAAAHIDPEKACYRALRDLTGFRPEMSPERLSELRQRSTVPASPEGHFELYALDESLAAFAYLRLGAGPRVPAREIGRASPISASPQLRLDEVLDSLSHRLHRVGAELYVKDCTHPTFRKRGLYAARAITPGLYPMWFGARRRRFAVSDRLRRLAETYTGRPFERARLQLAPHPMS